MLKQIHSKIIKKVLLTQQNTAILLVEMIHTTLRKKHQQKCQRQMLYLLDKFIKKSFLVYKVTLQSVRKHREKEQPWEAMNYSL